VWNLIEYGPHRGLGGPAGTDLTEIPYGGVDIEQLGGAAHRLGMVRQHSVLRKQNVVDRRDNFGVTWGREVNQMKPNLDVRLIRIARQMADLTQGELAKKAKINRSKISLFENGLMDLTEAELTRVNAVIEAASKRTPKSGVSQLSSLLNPISPTLVAEQFERERTLAQRESVESRKSFRIRAGLSQQELSKLTGIPRSKLSPWESGKLDLTTAEFETVRQVCVDRVLRKDPYFAAAAGRNWADELWKSNRELREKLEAVEAKNAALGKEIAALREWYDAMERAALAHAAVEDAVEETEKLPKSDERG
jgi:transcriptional regulator with XRE-family HTH domain